MLGVYLKKLRKFGLEYCDLPTMLSNVGLLLRVLTVTIEKNITIPFYFYICTIVMALCFFYVFLFSTVWLVFCRLSLTEDFVAAMIALSLGLTSEIGIVKLIYLCCHMDKLKQISEDYLACDAQMTPGGRFHENLLKAQRPVKKRAIFFWMTLVINAIMYIIRPVFVKGRNLPESNLIMYGLEPQFETPNFEISYAVIAIAFAFGCFVPANVTSYVIVIAGYSESQILALSEEMLQIWPDAVIETQEELKMHDIDENDSKTRIIINKFVDKRLKQLIIRHALIKTIFGKVEYVFRGAIIMGFTLLILGLIVELLGRFENTYLQLPFASIQVAMDCFIGQRVIDANEIFEQAVYGCQWEKFDKTNMKMVQVMLQSSQKTMMLSAGSLAQLRFSTLMAITRGTYSAYTALQSASF